jgi:glutamate-1-semialdehyde 2,1-aminomutase
MAAGLATLQALLTPDAWKAAEATAARLQQEIMALAAELKSPAEFRVQRCGTMLTVFFSDLPVTDWESARRCDTARFARFFRTLLENGVYWPPSQFEAAFVSTAHGGPEVDYSIRAMVVALKA